MSDAKKEQTESENAERKYVDPASVIARLKRLEETVSGFTYLIDRSDRYNDDSEVEQTEVEMIQRIVALEVIATKNEVLAKDTARVVASIQAHLIDGGPPNEHSPSSRESEFNVRLVAAENSLIGITLDLHERRMDEDRAKTGEEIVEDREELSEEDRHDNKWWYAETCRALGLTTESHLTVNLPEAVRDVVLSMKHRKTVIADNEETIGSLNAQLEVAINEKSQVLRDREDTIATLREQKRVAELVASDREDDIEKLSASLSRLEGSKKEENLLDESIELCKILGVDTENDYDLLGVAQKLVEERDNYRAGYEREHPGSMWKVYGRHNDRIHYSRRNEESGLTLTIYKSEPRFILANAGSTVFADHVPVATEREMLDQAAALVADFEKRSRRSDG